MTMARLFSARMFVKVAIIAAGVGFLPSASRADDFRPNAATLKAIEVLHRGQGPLALKLFMNESRRGNVFADLAIGELYFEGKNGIRRDYERATPWFAKAWRLGGPGSPVANIAEQRIEQMVAARGESPRNVKALLALGALAQMLPRAGAGHSGQHQNSEPDDPTGRYLGRRLFHEWTEHEFESPLFNSGE